MPGGGYSAYFDILHIANCMTEKVLDVYVCVRVKHQREDVKSVLVATTLVFVCVGERKFSLLLVVCTAIKKDKFRYMLHVSDKVI